jgi:hypothetical protein
VAATLRQRYANEFVATLQQPLAAKLICMPNFHVPVVCSKEAAKLQQRFAAKLQQRFAAPLPQPLVTRLIFL